MKFATSRSGWLAVTLAGTLALGACGDDPTGFEEHPEPEGVVLLLGGQVLASYDGSAWSGAVDLTVGQVTAQVTVQFVDDHGDPLEVDDEEYLDVIVGNTNVLEFQQTTPGGFGGTLRGKSAGQTTAVFRLMHGAVGAGHADFETAPLTVRVN